MASEPQPGPSNHGTTIQAPPPASANAPIYRATVQKCAALLDWWLVRGQGDKIRVAGYTERFQRYWCSYRDANFSAASCRHTWGLNWLHMNRAARVFTSDFITMRHADGTVETADHKIVLTRDPLNIGQMHRNGFPYEVSKHFQLGFPAQWEKYTNSNMKQSKQQAQSPSKSTEYYIEKFLSFMKSVEYNFKETDFNSSKGSTGNTDGTPIQGLSNLSNGTPRFQDSSGNICDCDNSISNMAASEELCNGRMGMPDDSFAGPGPGETCSSAQGDNQHQDMHLDAGEIVTHSTDSASVHNHTDQIISDLEKCGTHKSGNTLVHLGTEDAGQVPAKGMSPEFGVVQGSEDSTVRRLRSGKVYGMSTSSSASLKQGHSKRKTIQHDTPNRKMILNEETTPPVDPTNHGNVG